MKKANRPPLNRDINIDDFENYYWLKEELKNFCKELRISASGSKMSIAERISIYLSDGKQSGAIRKKIKEKGVGEPVIDYKNLEILNIDTVITSSFSCTQAVRAFFKSVAGDRFHFSTSFQNYCKKNRGKTFKDALEAYTNEMEQRKNGEFKPEIAPQFEYNTYTRDFFADPHNKGKSVKEAIACWKFKKSIAGHNRYEKTDLKILDNN